MARTWFTPVVLLTVAALALAACSSNKKSDGASTSGSTPTASTGSGGNNASLDPNNLVAQVFAAVAAAQSFHVVGSGKDQDLPYSIDVHFGNGGGSGYFSQGSARFDLAGHGQDTYVKTTAANWKATIGTKQNAYELALTLAPHWVRVPTTKQDFAQLLDYVDKDHFVTSYRESAASQSGPFAKGGTATVNGTPAVIYTDTKDNSKIYIAASGAPLLLKVESSASDGGGGLTITDYNKPFSPTLPAANEIIDYTSVVK
jgi:hypothetical protein